MLARLLEVALLAVHALQWCDDEVDLAGAVQACCVFVLLLETSCIEDVLRLFVEEHLRRGRGGGSAAG